MKMTYTTIRAAAELGCDPGRIRRILSGLGVKKEGRDYHFGDKIMARVRAQLHNRMKTMT